MTFLVMTRWKDYRAVLQLKKLGALNARGYKQIIPQLHGSPIPSWIAGGCAILFACSIIGGFSI